jgi:hypothetical protein
LDRLRALHAVAIVNENDTVATNEIRFGDNDRLSALVAHLVGADALVLLSDIDGLYDSDPRKSDARFIPEVAGPDDLDGVVAGQGSRLGTGGMASKLSSALLAADVTDSPEARVIPLTGWRDIGEVEIGTLASIVAMRRWPCSHAMCMQEKSFLYVDSNKSVSETASSSCTISKWPCWLAMYRHEHPSSVVLWIRSCPPTSARSLAISKLPFWHAR